MNAPSISVVMSVFNGEAFLSEAIESILEQTCRDFEFLVIDDGSSDKTAEILADYASRDRRIRVVRHENKGRAASLNIGISLAAGGYIARMDADDVALPHRLQDQLDFMERHLEVGLLGGAAEIINRAGRISSIYRPPLEDSEIRLKLFRNNVFFHPTVIMRNEVVRDSGGYRKALLDADDYDLWLRIAERSQMANLPGPVLRYRIHSEQVSVQNLRHQVLCVLAACAAASVRRGGGIDPLSHIEEITPQFLDSLGVKIEEIRQALLDRYTYWIDVLGPNEPEAVLRVIEGLLQLPVAERISDRSVLANTWLKAAGIHYRQGRSGRAIISAGRAVLVRPIVAGRPVKRTFARLATALKGSVPKI